MNAKNQFINIINTIVFAFFNQRCVRFNSDLILRQAPHRRLLFYESKGICNRVIVMT